MSPFRNSRTKRQGNRWLLIVLVGILWIPVPCAMAQEAPKVPETHKWIKEIEEIFLPSDHCKQCHDRHYEEWKGMREQTPDLKTFCRPTHETTQNVNASSDNFPARSETAEEF